MTGVLLNGPFTGTMLQAIGQQQRHVFLWSIRFG